MTVKAGYSTPMLQVADVERSLQFYKLLGFETIDVDRGPTSIGWARMHCEGGAIMFVRSNESAIPEDERFLLYLYTTDLPALREHLVASAVEVSPIRHPDHMRSGEISFKDPDSYSVCVGHWGEQEHEEWQRQLEEKRAAGLIEHPPTKAD